MSSSLLTNAPYTVRVGHLALALALGLFVGMEREWRHKHAGLRTFGFAALLGGIGGVLGPAYGVTSLVLVGLLVAVASAEALLQGRDVELTTSAALIVTTFAGILSGVGHTVTPTAVALTTAGLLAWKEELAGFTVGLTVAEVRNAVLVGILGATVLPAAAAPLSVLVLAPALLALRRGERFDDGVDIRLRSPFSLLSALKFGLVFLGLQVAGDLGQRYAGHVGFLAVSGVGGLISSASAVASAAALAAHHTLAPRLAGLGVAVASLASVVVDLPLVTRFSKDRPVTRRLVAQLVAILAAAALATGASEVLTS